ncbi:MAG: DUF4157 domain-containing protein [Thermosynechococcaceae cyanobacterium]
MTRQTATQTQQQTPATSSFSKGGILQRQCASCGQHMIAGGECSECAKNKGGLQRKLKIGASNDPLELEADRVADQVMAASARPAVSSTPPRIQRFMEQTVGQVDLEAPASVDRVLSSPGSPLEPALKQDMEQRFGQDFSQVRVHTDAAAERSANNVNALAYTVEHNIVFGAGQFAPGTHEGRRLIAHELTHVVQQDTHAWPAGGTVQRQPKPVAKGKKPATKSTAATAPKLDLTPSKNGAPCACLMVVHNDERNARKTAGLMHANCSYNLALISPDTSGRLIKIPGQKGSIDPNSLFPREIAEKCINDEQVCRDFLTSKSGTTDKDEIEQFVQTQFFLAVSDCSNGFSLPVVALHNNDVEDTKNYLKEKDKKGVSDLKLDVDKKTKETGDDQVNKLKDLIKKKFGESVKTEIMETSGKTNIFRWCASKDLSQCHIGDPDHPDNVTWVTNEKDFAALNKKDINVALQSEVPASKKSESEGDLSTLFLLLKDILNIRLTKVIGTLEKKQEADWKEIDQIFDDLKKIFEFHDQSFTNTLDRLLEILRLLLDILSSKLLLLTAPIATRARIEKLRYVNIESPGKRLGDQTDAERIRNYEAIIEVLKATGLHCCGDDPKKAEESIKEGLKEK